MMKSFDEAVGLWMWCDTWYLTTGKWMPKVVRWTVDLYPMMSSGMPKQAIQWKINAWAQLEEVVWLRGMAFGHRENGQLLWASEWTHWKVVVTRSTWMWSKRRLGTLNFSRGALMCVWIFDIWQEMHCLTHIHICYCKPFHTNLAEMCFLVVRTKGWDKPCITSKTWHLQMAGTISLWWPVEVSHNSVIPWVSKGTSCKLEGVAVQ